MDKRLFAQRNMTLSSETICIQTNENSFLVNGEIFDPKKDRDRITKLEQEVKDLKLLLINYDELQNKVDRLVIKEMFSDLT